jgi:acetate kinase
MVLMVRHNAPALELVKACVKDYPAAKNMAFFDTTFHRSLSSAVTTYAIPQNVAAERKLRKYGFHGISYANILRQTSAFLQKKPEDTSIIALHLGSGASVCAIKNGKSVDTSMGLTPLSGLMGSSRSGDVDPSLIFHFTEEAGAIVSNTGQNLHISMAEKILNKDSGWKAIAGTSNFGKISDAKKGKAKLAFDMFVDRIISFVGSYYVKLGGHVDAIVFAGGVGEKSIELRQAVIKACACLGFFLDDHMNEQNNAPKQIANISLHGTGTQILICHTDEQVSAHLIGKTTLSISSMKWRKRVSTVNDIPAKIMSVRKPINNSLVNQENSIKPLS